MQLKTIDIAEGYSIDVYDFGQGSPSIVFTAGIHGNEVTSIHVAEQLIAYLQQNPIVSGSIRVIPRSNAAAIAIQERRAPEDSLDLNRIFPGDEAGSLSLQTAAAVWKLTESFEKVVDLHCCGQHSLPYILAVYTESESARELAKKIPIPVAIKSNGTPGQLFTDSSRTRKQAALIIELPNGPSTGAVNREVTTQCFDALLSLLQTDGFLAAGTTSKQKEPSFYGPLQFLDAPVTGLWEPTAKKGDFLAAGEPLGRVAGQLVTLDVSAYLMSVKPFGYLIESEKHVAIYTEPFVQ